MAREKCYKQISAAIAKYREIKENINEGLKFYVTLQVWSYHVIYLLFFSRLIFFLGQLNQIAKLGNIVKLDIKDSLTLLFIINRMQ